MSLDFTRMRLKNRYGTSGCNSTKYQEIVLFVTKLQGIKVRIFPNPYVIIPEIPGELWPPKNVFNSLAMVWNTKT